MPSSVLPGHLAATEPESFLAAALRTGRAVVVGHGITGHHVVHRLFVESQRVSRPIQILWVADHHDRRVASFGASGWHMPFLEGDPRIAAWAHRSFHSWNILSELGFGEYRTAAPSVLLTREERVPVPSGCPAVPVPVDPGEFSAPFYRRAAYIAEGAIVSSCTLMPNLYRAVSRLPGVRPMRRHIHDIGELLELTHDFGAEVVCVAAGDRAQFLLDDQRIEGDLGVVLLADLARVPQPLDRIVLMDADRYDELTYSIPHHSCGHVCLGGSSGRLVTEPEEYTELGRGLTDPSRVPSYVTALVEEIRDRVLQRLPVLRPALTPGAYQYWYGLRPLAERVIAEWIPRSRTGSVGVLELGGLGGSGFTVAPAFVEDGLALRRPTPRMESHFGRPTPVHSS
ncbi:FAD-dependent oxidoreductase [Nocardia sp. alder85J]|uniref:FAD-dependent oxidoreductase n=1 Tax=Nocardia sp. alder85J TaxID=2862949 RepID=UPI001CD811AF|nr:FAD-dependent oxidoreductase [Nocardia sp. alder85J]MCX4093382.1 FAD-dependent oxidoreductase [Nocardia sp. alder85J]